MIMIYIDLHLHYICIVFTVFYAQLHTMLCLIYLIIIIIIIIVIIITIVIIYHVIALIQHSFCECAIQ